MSPHPQLVARELYEHWRSTGVRLRPGARVAEIDAFERMFQVHLPNCLRELLLLANGTETADGNGLCFWSVTDRPMSPSLEFGRIQPLSCLYSLAGEKEWFVFADHLINTSFVSVCVGGSRAEAICFHEPDNVIADSFGEFASKYLAGRLPI